MITNFYKNVNESFLVAHFALQNTKFGNEKGKVQKPPRIPPQTSPAGGKSAEAGQIQNPRKIVCPAESKLFPFHSLGFSAKWVLTFLNKHHHSEFVKEVASGLCPSALVSAKKFQGVLNPAKSIPAESRRFPNKVWIVPKAQEPMNRDFKIVDVMQNLLSI